MDTKDTARRRFDRWAQSYERDRRSRFNAKPQLAALQVLALEPRDRFLDVGCGPGAAVRAAASVSELAVGVDLAPRMIERARKAASGLPRAEFVVGDSERLPFADGSFTALLCTSSFHHYPEPWRALAEMARVLAPRGRVVLGDGTSDRAPARIADRLLRRFDRSHVGLYRTAELVERIGDAGFEQIGVRTLWDGGYAIVSARRSPASQE
jgi:ubiquinone/menaquinone biosynthesis C-methylase UbiE